jgi:two-component system LytT family response regulator
MRAIVVEDEKNVREVLIKLLAVFCPDVQVVGQAESVSDALGLIKTVEFDLAFLDIKLKGGTSLELLKYFQHRNFQVIFITAYDQYALDAFRLSAADYLLKPVSPDRLQEAVKKAEKLASKKDDASMWSVLQEHLSPKERSDSRIILKDAENMHVIHIKDILYCQAEGGYTQFWLLGGRKIITSQNLKEYESLLSSHGFIRVHHKYLANISHVNNFSRQDGGMLFLPEGHQVPVSYRKRDQVIKALRSEAIN